MSFFLEKKHYTSEPNLECGTENISKTIINTTESKREYYCAAVDELLLFHKETMGTYQKIIEDSQGTKTIYELDKKSS